MRFVAAIIVVLVAAWMLAILIQGRHQPQVAIQAVSPTPASGSDIALSAPSGIHQATSAASVPAKSLPDASQNLPKPGPLTGASSRPVGSLGRAIVFVFASPRATKSESGTAQPARSTPVATAPPSPQVDNQPQAQSHPELPPNVPYASNSDPVRIQSISLSSDTVHAGDVASATVITTSNAAALTARVGTYQINVPRTAPGTFFISLKVPRVPFAGPQVDIVVTAIRSDGATDQRSIPLKVVL